MEGFVDAYQILGVSPRASSEELKRAHRRLVRQHHPDLVPPEERPAATRRVQEINVAYGLVRDPAARARYDRLWALQSARARAAAPAQQAARAVRDAEAAAAAQWDALLRSAGRWSGRWWRRNRRRILAGAHRVRRAGVDLWGRVLWLVSCAAWLLIGGVFATAAARLTGTSGVVAPLLGVGVGLLVGHRRGWRRRLALAGLPADAAHRLRGPAELAAAGAVIGAGLGLTALLA